MGFLCRVSIGFFLFSFLCFPFVFCFPLFLFLFSAFQFSFLMTLMEVQWGFSIGFCPGSAAEINLQKIVKSSAAQKSAE